MGGGLPTVTRYQEFLSNTNQPISIVGRVFTNGLGDQGSIQVESYQRLKKWYLMPPCLTFSIIRYRSRVSGAIRGKEVEPSPTSQCNSYWKASLQVTLVNSRPTYLQIICTQLYSFKHSHLILILFQVTISFLW